MKPKRMTDRDVDHLIMNLYTIVDMIAHRRSLDPLIMLSTTARLQIYQNDHPIVQHYHTKRTRL